MTTRYFGLVSIELWSRCPRARVFIIWTWLDAIYEGHWPADMHKDRIFLLSHQNSPAFYVISSGRCRRWIANGGAGPAECSCRFGFHFRYRLVTVDRVSRKYFQLLHFQVIWLIRTSFSPARGRGRFVICKDSASRARPLTLFTAICESSDGHLIKWVTCYTRQITLPLHVV